MKDTVPFDPLLAPSSGLENTNPPDIRFIDLIAEDFVAHDRDILSQGFWALFWHRFGNLRMAIPNKILRLPFSALYKIMFKITEWFCGIHLPYTVRVGRRVVLEHFGGMIIVPQAIGNNTRIRQNTTIGVASIRDLSSRPVIGHGVDLGAGVVVIGRVKIGDHAVIGANAVVTSDIPAGCVAVGVPARIVRDSGPSMNG